MSKHVSYRGQTIDMDSIRRENEKSVAVGNMKANARGDRLNGTTVTKTADEMARERGRVQSVVVKTGLKGPMPKMENPVLPGPKTAKPVAPTTKKVKEIELPTGDIMIEGDDGEDTSA